MKFVVKEEQDGITTGNAAGDYLLLESISAEPGEEIRIRLVTESDLPPTAMSHFVLLTLSADVDAFVHAAGRAKDNDLIPADMDDQIVATTWQAVEKQWKTHLLLPKDLEITNTSVAFPVIMLEV